MNGETTEAHGRNYHDQSPCSCIAMPCWCGFVQKVLHRDILLGVADSALMPMLFNLGQQVVTLSVSGNSVPCLLQLACASLCSSPYTINAIHIINIRSNALHACCQQGSEVLGARPYCYSVLLLTSIKGCARAIWLWIHRKEVKQGGCEVHPGCTAKIVTNICTQLE